MRLELQYCPQVECCQYCILQCSVGLAKDEASKSSYWPLTTTAALRPLPRCLLYPIAPDWSLYVAQVLLLQISVFDFNTMMGKLTMFENRWTHPFQDHVVKFVQAERLCLLKLWIS